MEVHGWKEGDKERKMTDTKLEYFYMGRLDDCRKLDSKFAKIAGVSIREFFENLYKPFKKYFIKNEEETKEAA